VQNTFVAWLTIPAASAYFFNDVLAIISLLGSSIPFSWLPLSTRRSTV
jgi:hypothetical protein